MSPVVDTSWIQPQIKRFWDRNQKLRYLMALEIARQIVERPELIERGRRYIDQRLSTGHQTRPYDLMWRKVLERPAEEIGRRLIADTDEGDMLRASAPVFKVIEAKTRRRLLAEADMWSLNDRHAR